MIGFLLLPLNAYWAADVVSDIIFSQLVPPLCSLMVLALLNLLLRRFARALWPDACPAFSWPEGRALLNAFPEAMSIKEVVELLSAVGGLAAVAADGRKA